jgi:hypothetical protein
VSKTFLFIPFECLFDIPEMEKVQNVKRSTVRKQRHGFVYHSCPFRFLAGHCVEKNRQVADWEASSAERTFAFEESAKKRGQSVHGEFDSQG